MPESIEVESHPRLDPSAFITRFHSPLGDLGDWKERGRLQQRDAETPMAVDLDSGEEIRRKVRDLLRSAEFKPTGRSKPASEYLLRAVENETLTSINLAVDICNAVSLHSRLPISVVDLELTEPPYRIAVAKAGNSYVFNPSGQTMDIGGLLCLHDAAGACANGVKDSQRTKTSPQTSATLTIIWGTLELPGRATATEQWYRDLLHDAGAETSTVSLMKD